MTERVILQAKALHKSFAGLNRPIQVLAGADLTVHKGEAIAVVGPSGAGKSTLLHLLGGLDLPDQGEVSVGGQTMAEASSDAAWRAEKIGFVFQYHHLLPEFTALENVSFPFWLKGIKPGRRPEALLDKVGLAERLHHIPAHLSGGEQQRVAIARAVATEPQLVLADEPTGNLDPETGARTFAALRALQSEQGFSLVVATHSERMARRCDRVLKLEEGLLGPLSPAELEHYFR